MECRLEQPEEQPAKNPDNQGRKTLPGVCDRPATQAEKRGEKADRWKVRLDVVQPWIARSAADKVERVELDEENLERRNGLSGRSGRRDPRGRSATARQPALRPIPADRRRPRTNRPKGSDCTFVSGPQEGLPPGLLACTCPNRAKAIARA